EILNQLPKTLVEKFINNDGVLGVLSKTSVKFQDGVLNILIKIEEKGWDLVNVSDKFVSYLKKIGETKWGAKILSGFTKFSNSALGKVVSSPWFGLVVDAGYSAFKDYHDKD